MKMLTKDKSFYKSLISLAIPISLQNLITFAVGFADNLMIGDLGDYSVSGVYMGNQPQTVLQMLIGGTAMAMQVMAAQYWGRKDTQRIKLIVSMCIRYTMIVCAVITAAAAIYSEEIIRLFAKDAGVIAEGSAYLRIVCFSYFFFCLSQLFIAAMRSVEVAKIGLYVSILSLACNISLNYVLIFGKLGFPAMGVRGAAAATLISRIVEAAFIIYYVMVKDKRLGYRIKDLFQKPGEEVRLLRGDFFRYGLPIISGDIVWAINNLASSAILGRYSAEVVTASSMTNMMNTLVYVWTMGLSAAVGIITGKTVGAGKTETMKEYARTVQLIFLCLGLVSGGLVFLLKEPLLSMYNVSAEAKLIGSQFMNVLAFTIIGTCYQAACLGGLVKAGGDTSFVFKNDTIFVFLVVIPSSVITSYFGLPIWVVFLCLKCDQILKCFIAVVKINSFNWMKKLTR